MAGFTRFLFPLLFFFLEKKKQTKQRFTNLCSVPCMVLQDDELIQKAEEAFKDAVDVANSDGWKVEKQTAEGDVVHSKFIRRNHKIFRITVSGRPSFLLFRFFFSVSFSSFVRSVSIKQSLNQFCSRE